MHVILEGCRPEPLTGYLKALAVLRLIAEQKDAKVQGWWENDEFHIESKLDETQLLDFFVKEYSPTPIVAPWNGGSGFYEGDRIDARQAILGSADVRLNDYRSTIGSILSWNELPQTGRSLGQLVESLEQSADKKEGKAWDELRELITDTRKACLRVQSVVDQQTPWSVLIDDLRPYTRKSPDVKELYRLARKLRTQAKSLSRKVGKEAIIQACRSRLSDRAIQWLDAAVVLGSENDLSFPPLLGSGANEGRLDYSNTFMGCVADLWLENTNDQRALALLRHALLGAPASGLVNKPVGQYDPGRAGGYNQGPGIEKKDFPVNPWDCILTLEGAILWAPGIARRHGSVKGVLCSPFTVRTTPVGYVSATQREQAEARSEIWAPIWNKSASYAELRSFLSEGRAEVGTGRRARNAIEFAEAAASLGIDRGIKEFVRYSLLKRRGDSYVAVPAGRFSVKFRAECDLVRELTPVLRRLDWWLRKFPGQSPPDSYMTVRRGVDAALYDVLRDGGALRMNMLVRAIGRIEKLVAARDLAQDPKLNAPLCGLSPRWILAADDGSPEVRLAAALASIRPQGNIGPIRANLAPVDPTKPWSWSQAGNQVSWHGHSFAVRLAGVLAKRMMDASRLGVSANPLAGAIPLHAEDIAAFVDGGINETLLEDLLFGFTWIEWHRYDKIKTVAAVLRERWSSPTRPRTISRPWALLKMLFLPDPIVSDSGQTLELRPEPALLPLLCAGRLREACETAQRRLNASGLAPYRISYPDSANSDRLAGALLLPVRNPIRLLRLICAKN